jgi:hypothetical protein
MEITMTRFDVFSRVITAAALVALGVILGVWLTRSPLTAAAPPSPVKIAPQPILAPPPTPPIVAPSIIEVPVEVEIAASAAAAPEPPSAKPLEPTAEPRPACQPRRRGIFGRRRQ